MKEFLGFILSSFTFNSSIVTATSLIASPGTATTLLACDVGDEDTLVYSSSVSSVIGVYLLGCEYNEYLNSMSSEELTTVIEETYNREEQLESTSRYQQLESELNNLRNQLNDVSNQEYEQETTYQKVIK